MSSQLWKDREHRLSELQQELAAVRTKAHALLLMEHWPKEVEDLRLMLRSACEQLDEAYTRAWEQFIL